LKLDYFHYSVNHSIEEYSKQDQLPPQLGSGIFTNTSNHIEEIWGELKGETHTHAHRHAGKLDELVDEIMFRHSQRSLLDLLRVQRSDLSATSGNYGTNYCDTSVYEL
jgi:hypothetical protein